MPTSFKFASSISEVREYKNELKRLDEEISMQIKNKQEILDKHS